MGKSHIPRDSVHRILAFPQELFAFLQTAGIDAVVDGVAVGAAEHASQVGIV